MTGKTPFYRKTMKVIFLLIVLLFRIKLAKVKSQGVMDDQGKLTGYSCDKTQSVTEKLTTDEIWLKSAQLIAFCIDKVGFILFCFPIFWSGYTGDL